MTLAISMVTSSGIVLSADSRQTYKNMAGVIRIGSDSVMKVFNLTHYCGVTISGKAFLIEDQQSLKDIGYFIDKFRKTENLKNLEVKNIAEKLNKYLGNIFVQSEKKAMKKTD
jgi:20S proteasome alpha/beta subunit